MKQEKLDDAAISEGLAALEGWTRSDDGIAIEKRYTFKSFREAFGFIFQQYNLLATATATENVEVPAIYAGAEVFVFPSLYEGFGLPALEAMACGACIVASDTEPVREVIEDGRTGMLVGFFDVTQVASKVLAAVESRSSSRAALEMLPVRAAASNA